MLKTIIVVLILLMIVTLGTGLQSLLARKNPNRLVWILWLRVAIGISLIALLIIGGLTGQLTITAPWAGQY